MDTPLDIGKIGVLDTQPHGGTMLFDVVAVAFYYPEYFWMGNAHERFLAYGVFENGDPGNVNGDERLLSRGRKVSGNKPLAILV